MSSPMANWGATLPSSERERERGMEGSVGGWQNSHGMDLLLAFEKLAKILGTILVPKSLKWVVLV